MTAINPTSSDMEPAISAMLDRAAGFRRQPPYRVKRLPEVEQALTRFLARQLERPQVVGLRRMGGGASKEQFTFELVEGGGSPRRCVLRMDPLEGAVVSCRRREVAILQLVQGHLPAPAALWHDVDGSQLGNPALITSFVDGVTKPSASSSNISGFGTAFPPAVRQALGGPFIRYLATLHRLDWRKLAPDCFQAPTAHPQQSALWQLNWWSRVWREDVDEGFPLMGLAERWMRDNLPAAGPDELVFVHSDYRTGNFLYDEKSLEITAILDWELIHIGDFHEDLAWTAISSWSSIENGVHLASGLMPLDQLCDSYSAATGRRVNRRSLYFYQVLGLYKCVAICLATSVRAASLAHNHQDALLTWLAAAGYAFLADLCDLLERGEPA